MAFNYSSVAVLVLAAATTMACDDGGAPVATGPGAGGTAGAGGAGIGGAGVGGAGVGGSVTMSPSTPVPASMGWVDATTNTVGIQGAFYTFSDIMDGGASTIMPASFETATDQLCVSGEASQVLDGMFGVYYGATLGFNLSQEPGLDAANPYNATANGVTGFGFTVSELPQGGALRFTVKVPGSDASYCAPVKAAGYNEFRFTDLNADCWTGAPTGGPSPDALEALHWQMVTNEQAGYAFSFCLSGLVALQ